MIDIHVHILPHVDDGAQSIEESLVMAERESSDQVTCVVATPHSGLWGEGLSHQAVFDGLEELRGVLADKGISLALLPGLEVFINPSTAEQAAKGDTLTINRTRFLLIELPLQSYPRYTEQVLFELQLKKFAPVLAHPERYTAIQNDLDLLHKMVERGVLTQLTAGSITGQFGRKVQQTAEIMLEHNLVHVIASDAHDPEMRPPILSEAVEQASRIVGRERATAMVTAVPEAIINNQMPPLPEPIPVRRKKGWALWR